MEKRPTINDVARLAGVSKRTVSRVINGASNVGESTRRNIQRVIDELGFSPDKQARGLAASRSYLLGLIYDNSDALFIDQIQRGALDVCARSGYELVVHPCDSGAADHAEKCVSFVQRSNIDGVIILPPLSESVALAAVLRQRKIHYVRLASLDLDDHTNIVVSDDRAAVSELARYLVSQGHTSIAVITGPMHYHSSAERLEGLTETLAALGGEVPQSHIFEGNNTYKSGVEGARSLLQMTPRPRMIFANNDEMAAGVLRVAHEMGIAVPDELSVAGFDDNLLASRMIPSLTTVRRPVAAMASLAAQKIIRKIENSADVETDSYQVRSQLIIRESTRKTAK
ncbi:LacI family DNA-binding transcriptional regulator [Alteromonas aestuariivivens]|uniref:LacI family DNA-binding transcriptional regulator n=1 Tax=Alteromonas aestuariivivens TaxID=1938339 RepID=A0A3D8M7E6_9ALTE|nr:LacI family DNA-binding transcriptional regulator [Alteromonas aestuariivivens]RDV25474.1 LacI family DNA-binding transcriptional regulator [Alteromonas aestuariivivens]